MPIGTFISKFSARYLFPPVADRSRSEPRESDMRNNIPALKKLANMLLSLA